MFRSDSASRRRLSPELIISCLALFAALSGTALAIGLSRNEVESRNIAPGAVHGSDIHAGALTVNHLGFLLGNKSTAIQQTSITGNTDPSPVASLSFGSGGKGIGFMGDGSVRVANPSIPGSGTATAHVIIAVALNGNLMNSSRSEVDIADGTSQTVPVLFTITRPPAGSHLQLEISGTGADVTINGGTFNALAVPAVQ